VALVNTTFATYLVEWTLTTPKGLGSPGPPIHDVSGSVTEFIQAE
jgi:hypothetical protein